MPKQITVIIPAYNEAESIPLIYERLQTQFNSLPYDLSVLVVNDGSKDHSLDVLQKLAENHANFYYVSLARNFGHQLALKAGIDAISGDVIVNMDCDLQHPVEVIPELLKQWEAGYDIVYTIRKEDSSLPLLKRLTSKAFYVLLNKLSDVNLEAGAADFRLYDRRVHEVVQKLNEKEPFLRGIFKWVGFKQTAVEYQPNARTVGESKYTLKKMVKLATVGLTSFSTRPLYVAVYLGFAFSALSLLYIPYIFYALLKGITVSGWVSLISLVVLIGGIQLVILGIIGIYIGRIFNETKNRPEYIIDRQHLPEE